MLALGPIALPVGVCVAIRQAGHIELLLGSGQKGGVTFALGKCVSWGGGGVGKGGWVPRGEGRRHGLWGTMVWPRFGNGSSGPSMEEWDCV